MRVLVACEFSGVVRDAFIACGHDAWSCDLEPSEQPGPHIIGDVLLHLADGWDLMLAFPPCTHLAASGAKHFAAKRADGRQQAAVDFFLRLANAGIPRICIENPIGIMSRVYRKPDQIIQPWMFGHEARKPTCLWLRGLPRLTPTSIVGEGRIHTTRGGKRIPVWYNLPPSPDRAKIRSRTFSGIAAAMAAQWSPVC